MTYHEHAEQNGVEPECDSCNHWVHCRCTLEDQGIECDGISEFISDGR